MLAFHFFSVTLFILLVLLFRIEINASPSIGPAVYPANEWIYNPGAQFPAGSEALAAPTACIFSIYMGKIKYGHMPLLVSSMNHNPTVKFNIINIVEKVSDAEDTLKIIQTFNKFNNVDNVHLEILTMTEFSKVIKNRLNIDVSLDLSWGYKMCDYKPTLAYLFPHLSKDNSTYSFWGFADMDIIWGSFQKHASSFTGREKIVISGWWHSTGAAVFMVNEKWTREMFLQSKRYVSLLKENIYHNLDEGGTQVDQKQIVDDGKWSMDQLQREQLQKIGMNYKTGKNEYDHMFIDDEDCREWAGIVIWHAGSLEIVKASKYFPPGRQLLFYHSRSHASQYSLPAQPEFRGDAYFQDMATYGFILPSYTPLFSRYMCQNHEHGGYRVWQGDFHEYKPYAVECFGKLDKHSYGLA